MANPMPLLTRTTVSMGVVRVPKSTTQGALASAQPRLRSLPGFQPALLRSDWKTRYGMRWSTATQQEENRYRKLHLLRGV
jgi:hypothetical protein